MTYLPIFLDIKNEWSLVIGGKSTAARKVETLLRGGGKVRVISKSFNADFKGMMDTKLVDLVQKSFSSSDLHGIKLVISATENQKPMDCFSDPDSQCRQHRFVVTPESTSEWKQTIRRNS